jgi:UDP-N-acetylglucosamine acyltransferase
MKAHPTAIIHPQAQIACSVTVGPYTVIGEGVEIGEDCEVMSHVVIEGPTRIGKRNRFFPYGVIGLPCQDLKYKGEPTRLEIGDDNVIREFVTLHRGTADGRGETQIGNQDFLMAYVHIAHDCRLGDHVIMAGGFLWHPPVLPHRGLQLPGELYDREQGHSPLLQDHRRPPHGCVWCEPTGS